MACFLKGQHMVLDIYLKSAFQQGRVTREVTNYYSLLILQSLSSIKKALSLFFKRKWKIH